MREDAFGNPVEETIFTSWNIDRMTDQKLQETVGLPLDHLGLLAVETTVEKGTERCIELREYGS